MVHHHSARECVARLVALFRWVRVGWAVGMPVCSFAPCAGLAMLIIGTLASLGETDAAHGWTWLWMTLLERVAEVA